MIPKRLIERTWFRSLPLILGGVLLLLIAFGIAVAVRWHMAANDAEDPVLVAEPVYVQDGSQDAEPAIGTHFAAVLKYRLPWSDSFKVAAAEPGKNLQLTADPVIRRTGVHWGYFRPTAAANPAEDRSSLNSSQGRASRLRCPNSR